ncbi:spore coat protein U-like protein [Variovorax boronicumulans]|uniref:Spore coat protein U-like protein n=1 Tax=Variovorax boronicumulans TaxID=436515 RepID=A0AAW8E031_9BURK|nr:spore coat U domain-containing protein [Variovorax boronicumulans]MDP9879414.1 spore coat protein U-like protein [Variovorax boronicumulans]MDP9918489.1 spore coat protein U-like protein [Variovorax boronicumulans]MDP9924909.1 spore coat protein U-like protein [Variovorax boronicumulans]
MRHQPRSLLRTLARTVLPVGALLTLLPAQAVTTTTTFQVTATVLKACLMTTPATLAFGPYDPASATALAGTTSLNVTCTFGTPYSLGLSAGSGSGATVTNRLMTSPTAAAGNNTLGYGLFKDSAHQTNWDNSVAGTGYVGNGTPQTQTIYGLIPTGQYTAAPAIDYTDTITVSLTY